MHSLPVILSEVLRSCPEWTVSGRRCPLCLQSHLATVRPSRWIASPPLVPSGSSWPDSSPGGINWRMSDFEVNKRTALGCWIWPAAVPVRAGGQELLLLPAVSQKTVRDGRGQAALCGLCWPSHPWRPLGSVGPVSHQAVSPDSPVPRPFEKYLLTFGAQPGYLSVPRSLLQLYFCTS